MLERGHTEVEALERPFTRREVLIERDTLGRPGPGCDRSDRGLGRVSAWPVDRLNKAYRAGLQMSIPGRLPARLALHRCL